jgi:hypothetical protein
MIGGGFLLLFGAIFGPTYGLAALCVCVMGLCVWQFTKETR